MIRTGHLKMRKNLSRSNVAPTHPTAAELRGITIEIKSSLLEKDINLHILNNNFFETKKFLEKDDTESHYLIYSPEAERDAQSNWLLDIQLYSSGFENSTISDIKSEFGIEGYNLDKLLEDHEKFWFFRYLRHTYLVYNSVK
jgi:hypothetical protein